MNCDRDPLTEYEEEVYRGCPYVPNSPPCYKSYLYGHFARVSVLESNILYKLECGSSLL